MPPAHSSSTLVNQGSPTSLQVSFKPTAVPNPHPSQAVTLHNLTHTPLATRLKRKWTKLALARPLAAPILSTTLGFILLSDDKSYIPSTTASQVLCAADAMENTWLKLWCPHTGQPQRSLSSGADVCALASVHNVYTLTAALKYWLLFTCEKRWPNNEPLVPLDVIMDVYENCALRSARCMQKAIEARLAATQAADFALLVAHLRAVVTACPSTAEEVVQAWAPVMTRIDLELAKVGVDWDREDKQEQQKVRKAVNEVMAAVIDPHLRTGK